MRIMFQIIECPNCKTKIKAILQENRWVKWIEVNCDSCGFRNKIKDLDFIQPSSPFFKAIYKKEPIKNYEKEKKEEEKIKDNLKDKREIELKLRVNQGSLKPWQLKDIKHYTRERGIE